MLDHVLWLLALQLLKAAQVIKVSIALRIVKMASVMVFGLLGTLTAYLRECWSTDDGSSTRSGALAAVIKYYVQL